MQTSPQARPRPWLRVIAIWALGWCAACGLIALQYARPMPLGGAYVLRPSEYAPFARWYEALGLFLLSLPSLVLALLPMSGPRTWRFGTALQITLLTLSLVLSQLNHELQRFMGAQLDWDTLITYCNVFRTPPVIWDALRDDRGGAYSALWIDFIALGFAALAYACWRMPPRKLPFQLQALVIGLFVGLGLIQPLAQLQRPGLNRKLKLRPPLVLLWDSTLEGLPNEQRYADIQAAITRWQEDWLAQDGSGQYRFDSAPYPLRHRRITPLPQAAGARRPNIILLSLETFRARDMAAFNPALERRPTPFLDALARDPHSAYYPRYITNGLPTIFAFMSMQTGTLPHSQRVVASSFARDSLDSFPNVLRDRGYRTMFFTASDPDWDNERMWLERWYDETHYIEMRGERDRKTFSDAAERITRVAQDGRPFLATIASINNHYPFRTPDHNFDVGPGNRPRDRIQDTMHYTDDVVRQFVQRLRREPWFADTVLIVTGDHAYDLGERGRVIGHDNLRHESTWVPLILHGRSTQLPRGMQSRVASHIDLAPTIAELAGSSGPYAFQGHSLLEPATDRQLAVAVRNGNLALEAGDFSAYLPAHGRSKVYAASDRLQQDELDKRDFPTFSESEARARNASLVTDWAFEHDRFAPGPGSPGGRPLATGDSATATAPAL